ncbi:hypothetical protein V1L54_17375 [Streptomyces sp. TRM 70361]|uniref:hypothetical protein n=1 Tax=Streptomyces sp. TRM 70361 TaxID=3116553 RepID=UPI002E7BDAB3|nr:hypothetical protein [Streptomyces sp. TRM 70361]MEE1941153.1 hypothetical protein [Streptomyces sp. TRM 70361]
MKVKFVGADGHEQRIRQGSQVLRVDRVYVVLEVYCQSDGQNYLRIEHRSDDLPPLFDSCLFEVVDAKISPVWRVSTGWDGSLRMAPEEWHAEGFWDDFMNHDPCAIEKYERCRDAILRS